MFKKQICLRKPHSQHTSYMPFISRFRISGFWISWWLFLVGWGLWLTWYMLSDRFLSVWPTELTFCSRLMGLGDGDWRVQCQIMIIWHWMSCRWNSWFKTALLSKNSCLNWRHCFRSDTNACCANITFNVFFQWCPNTVIATFI